MPTNDFDQNKLLALSAEVREEDRRNQVVKISEEQRKDYRLIFQGGYLCHDDLEKVRFNSRAGISHGKSGFVSFTFNCFKELCVFNHLGKRYYKASFCHSSINGDLPLIAAGELEIDKSGRLISLTGHSGHYRPKLYNLCFFLHVLQQQGVKISEATLYLKDPLPKELSHLQQRRIMLQEQEAFYSVNISSLILSSYYQKNFTKSSLSTFTSCKLADAARFFKRAEHTLANGLCHAPFISPLRH